MKRLIFCLSLVGVLSAFAADPDPMKGIKIVDPNPYSDYRLAMAADAKRPMAVEWQAANAEAIAAATEEDVLASFVNDAAAADALLAQVVGAYRTDPLVMTQIGAVTQWVMGEEPCWLCFWAPSPKAGRAVWVAALKRKLAGSTDVYVKTFCRQQLDLCE